jgi:hypothetical protein
MKSAVFSNRFTNYLQSRQNFVVYSSDDAGRRGTDQLNAILKPMSTVPSVSDVPVRGKLFHEFAPIKAGAEHDRYVIYSSLLSVPLCWVRILSFAMFHLHSRLTFAAASEASIRTS